MNPAPNPETDTVFGPLQTEWIGHAGWPAILEDWQALADQDPRGGFFAGPAFATAYAAVFAGRAACEVLVMRDSGKLVGIVPMMVTRVARGRRLEVRHDYLAGDLRLLATPGLRPLRLRQISPLLGLEASLLASRMLAVSGAEARVWAAIPAALQSHPGWDLAVFPVAEAAVDALQAGARAAGLDARFTRLDRPIQALQPVIAADALIGSQNKKFRQNMRRAERFAAEAGITVSLVMDAPARAALPAFADLAGRSWKASPASDRAIGQAVVVPYDGPQRAMAESLAVATGLRPVLAIASGSDGAMRAACLAFATAQSLTTFVLVQDTDAGRESLGHLVLHGLINHAHAAGLTRLDYNANSSWLAAYANGCDMVQDLTLFAPNLRGRGLSLLARAMGGR
ncbi:GNAT family N-acetyltransferase [Rhodobacter ferrooxidans]|uniref:BioF2-like acetyltransferase domain-containing protein n=1 Tax=Rhodobacter ferrooxidans TaxID=371731 RepID=C8S494_9RHOB|nr:GNAT family N-acetyltransferase [Rhodobacter sp. SW2]EEW24153.1 hypothetical protein Rsw2DRAFT_2872 [Rhodobacter sp. SW2]